MQLNSKKQKQNLIKKRTEKLNRYFSKEDIQMVKRYVKKCWTSLVIREMQIKTTMRYYTSHLLKSLLSKTTPPKANKQKNPRDNKC